MAALRNEMELSYEPQSLPFAPLAGFDAELDGRRSGQAHLVRPPTKQPSRVGWAYEAPDLGLS